jgi:hypothetical protein
MANILWIQPDQTLALTTIIIDGIDSQLHAIELQERGDIPSDWTIAGYDVEWPTDGYPQEAYRWVNNTIQVDQTALAAIQAKNAQPTVSELQAQLTALQAQITALTATPAVDPTTPADTTAAPTGA